MKKTAVIAVSLVYFLLFQFSFICYGKDIELKFKSDGSFKIVQFTDLHEKADENYKTIKLMEQVLDYEKPDLVLLTGDNTLYSEAHFRNVRAILNIAEPIEKRKIPWAAILGNHDTEGNDSYRKILMNIYSGFSHNVGSYNKCSFNIPVLYSNSNIAAFNIYMLDSGSYTNDNKYSYLGKEEIELYKNTSNEFIKKYNKNIPSLMFFHIPLIEQNKAYSANKIYGERNEAECPQSQNSGLFSEIVKRGDIAGVFSGHDHTNDYIGMLNGIKLGYGRCSGYNAYGKNFERGARVFLISQNEPYNFKTWIRLQSDFK